jgi:hypothetical protein
MPWLVPIIGFQSRVQKKQKTPQNQANKETKKELMPPLDFSSRNTKYAPRYLHRLTSVNIGLFISPY